MTDLKKELVQKIKKGQVPVRILHLEVYYPFKCKYINGSYLDELHIVNTDGKDKVGDGKDKVGDGTEIYRDNTVLVKKMNKLVDDLREAIELEDYSAMKKMQESMDKLESDRQV